MTTKLQTMVERLSTALRMERGPRKVSVVQEILSELGLSPLPQDLGMCVVATISESNPPSRDSLSMILGGVTWDAWSTGGGKAVFKKALASIVLGGEVNAEYINLQANLFNSGSAPSIGAVTNKNGKRRLMQVSEVDSA
jgi:hypothetical protein